MSDSYKGHSKFGYHGQTQSSNKDLRGPSPASQQRFGFTSQRGFEASKTHVERHESNVRTRAVALERVQGPSEKASARLPNMTPPRSPEARPELATIPCFQSLVSELQEQQGLSPIPVQVLSPVPVQACFDRMPSPDSALQRPSLLDLDDLSELQEQAEPLEYIDHLKKWESEMLSAHRGRTCSSQSSEDEGSTSSPEATNQTIAAIYVVALLCKLCRDSM